jgi:hypothetical protein
MGEMGERVRVRVLRKRNRLLKMRQGKAGGVE